MAGQDYHNTADRAVQSLIVGLPRSASAGARCAKRKYLGGCAALALACSLSTSAWAGTYTAFDDASLRAAIAAANASPDPSSTITLTNSFAVLPGALPTPAKILTIDTQSFTLSGPSGSVRFAGTFPTGSLTILGTFAGTGGGAGLSVDSQVGSGTAQVINNGSISGGPTAGIGAATNNAVTIINNGTVSGGAVSIANGTVNNAAGVSLQTLGSFVNNGTVQGGNNIGTGRAGQGVYMSGNGTVTNNSSGIIRGGSDLTGGTAGFAGITARFAANTILNSGTIIGGTGAAAITTQNTATITLVNSGVIQAGAGQADAIQMLTGRLTLELQAGSVIQGNVVANAAYTSDTLRLGGTANGTFDGAIGSQYQNFDIFEKTGTSTWTMTGASTIAAPWQIQQGVLQLGAGGTSGSLTGDVVNAGILAFNRSDALTFGGTISGTGSVSQIGTGTTILTGTNSYTGGTFLNGGTLSVANEANLGDAAGALNFNGGVLQVTGTGFTSTTRAINWGGGGFDIADPANIFTVGQVLAGGGSLTKLGPGTLIVTATDTYTAGTTISAGRLQLGNGGTTGSLAGNVTNNASLVFNRSDAVGFGGAISGTGSVSQIGSGTTTLSAINTYAGGTTIAAGTLIGSVTSFGNGAITDNAALVIDQPTDASFANAINGTGSVTKRGAGRLNYTGTGTLSGPTTVAAGLLSVNGSLAGSAVTVQNAASLGGNGTVGATTVQSGGTIAPGNSIGTLHINGAFTQSAGSIYQVEVDPNSNASDRILVSGAATLQSGAGLNVIKYVPGEYQAGTVYTVLTANGGLSGSYTVTGQTSGVSAFLGLRDSYDANNAYLTVVQTRDPISAAQTGNQQAVATAIDTLPVTNAVNTAVLNLPDDASARSAFDQLSAAAQASAKSALVSNSLYLRDVSFDRLRDVLCPSPEQNNHVGCGSERLSFWAQGFGGWGGLSGNANAAGLNHSMAGALVGVDVPVADWRVGVFGGASHSDFHLVNGAATGGSSDYHLGAYGGTQWDAFALRLGASYSWDSLTTDRAVTVGSLTNRLQATYQGGTTQAFTDLGYRFEVSDIRFEPFANLAYVSLHTPAFSEVGGPAALNVQADTIDNAVTTLGMRPSTDVRWEGWNMTLRGMMGWRHTFGRVVPTATASFAGSNAFTVSGAPIARDTAAIEAGVDFGLYDNITAGLTYGGQFSNRSTDQIARGTIRIAF